MRRINAKYYEVWDVEGTDDYGQPLPPTYTERDVECNIAMSSQVVVQDDARFVLTYYTGLTWDTDLQVGQELRADKHFRILEVNTDARMTQLTLEEVA